MSKDQPHNLDEGNPYWTSYLEGYDDGRETGDPLGFREAANQIARILVPGLTQRTRMTRGFTLLVLGLFSGSRLHVSCFRQQLPKLPTYRFDFLR